MRIVFVNSARGWGGGWRSAMEVAGALAEKGHQVTVACHPRSVIREQLEGNAQIDTAPVAIRAELNPYRVLQLARLNHRVRPDLVLADRRKDVKLSAVARHLGGDFPIVHRHGGPSPLKDSRLYRYFWGREVQTLVVNSHTMRQRLAESALWLADLTIRVVHNGKDIEHYRPHPELRKPMRAELGLPDDAFVVSFHGVLGPRKNVELLVRAVAELPPSLGVYGLIVGSGPSEPELRRLAGELNASIVFVGIRTDIPEVLSAADVGVHLSTAEGFSNSVLESMACGLPMIVSDATSHPEQVGDGLHGLLVPAGRWEGVAAAIRRLVSGPEDRARMGEAARRRVRDAFSRERMVEGYDEVMRETLDRHRARSRDR
jgi:glycosyltransferase involved in cell wall biosynthesis